MQHENTHLSDQDLLLVADGEAPGRRAAAVRAHLEACWHCRARMAQIERAIVDFVQAHTNDAAPKLSASAGPRALLRARMAGVARTSHSRWETLRSLLAARKLAYACALLLIAALGARILYQRAARHSSGEIVDAGLLPNPQLTPGATRPVAIGDLCSMPHDEVVRRVPNTLQRQVFNEYGVPSARAAEYEVDYLITPGLGGSDDIRNLWPQPHYDATWNSYVKDQLEEHLHSLVCAGQLDLPTAQRQIASNWIVAYKKYFETGGPPSGHFKPGELPGWGITYFYSLHLPN